MCWKKHGKQFGGKPSCTRSTDDMFQYGFMSMWRLILGAEVWHVRYVQYILFLIFPIISSVLWLLLHQRPTEEEFNADQQISSVVVTDPNEQDWSDIGGWLSKTDTARLVRLVIEVTEDEGRFIILFTYFQSKILTHLRSDVQQYWKFQVKKKKKIASKPNILKLKTGNRKCVS